MTKESFRRRQAGQRIDKCGEIMAKEEQQGLVTGPGEHDVQETGSDGERGTFAAVEVVGAELR